MSQLGAGGGTGYPAAVDTTTTEVNSPAAGKTLVDADKINDMSAAIIAIQTELGVNPAGTLSTLLARLAVETNTDGTHSDVTADSLVLAGKLNTVSATVASAAEAAIGAANGNLILITGTTTIDNFDELAEGTIKLCRFADVLTLTHSATETVNITGADIVTAAGDYTIYVSRGSTKRWDMVSYQRASGEALSAAVGTQTFTADGTYTVPAGVTELLCELVGGGGGGGGGSGGAGQGGGGAAGAKIKCVITVVPGEEINVAVGPGGAGGAPNVNGTAGTASTVETGEANAISAPGGGGGGQAGGAGAGTLGTVASGELIRLRSSASGAGNVGPSGLGGIADFGDNDTSPGHGGYGTQNGTGANGSDGYVIIEPVVHTT